MGSGDYVVIPTSTTHRWLPQGPEALRLLVIEASGHVVPPRRYLSSHGQFLEHSPFCERDLRGPGEPLLVEGSDVEVLVRHRSGLTRYTYATHPFDVVGWDGCLYPYAFSIYDFEPITGRVHQPPPVHQTFEGPNFVICSFVPRLFDYHPQGIPAPYNHANVDSDEVLFYVGGDFMSRKGAGIVQGSMSLHPSGFTHGPQPGSVEASIGKAATDELAVMVDTFRPLDLGPAATACEDAAYPWTWARGPWRLARGRHPSGAGPRLDLGLASWCEAQNEVRGCRRRRSPRSARLLWSPRPGGGRTAADRERLDPLLDHGRVCAEPAGECRPLLGRLAVLALVDERDRRHRSGDGGRPQHRDRGGAGCRDPCGVRPSPTAPGRATWPPSWPIRGAEQSWSARW